MRVYSRNPIFIFVDKVFQIPIICSWPMSCSPSREDDTLLRQSGCLDLAATPHTGLSSVFTRDAEKVPKLQLALQSIPACKARAVVNEHEHRHGSVEHGARSTKQPKILYVNLRWDFFSTDS